MSDNPNPGRMPPLYICSYMKYFGPISATYNSNLAGPSSQSWGTANRAFYMPFDLPFAYNIKRVFWANGSALGNSDIGIYSNRGSKIYSSGSVAQSGASALQFVTLSPDILLPPGRYFLGFSNDGTTNRVSGSLFTLAADARMGGLLMQTSAFPLPTSMAGTAYTATLYPLCGFTSTV